MQIWHAKVLKKFKIITNGVLKKSEIRNNVLFCSLTWHGIDSCAYFNHLSEILINKAKDISCKYFYFHLRLLYFQYDLLQLLFSFVKIFNKQILFLER